MLTSLLLLVGCLGLFAWRIAPLGRELSRLLIGRKALSKCRQADIPAVIEALGFESRSPWAGKRTDRL